MSSRSLAPPLNPLNGFAEGLQEEAPTRSHTSKGLYKKSSHYEHLSHYLDVAWEWIRRTPRVHPWQLPCAMYPAVEALVVVTSACCPCCIKVAKCQRLADLAKTKTRCCHVSCPHTCHALALTLTLTLHLALTPAPTLNLTPTPTLDLTPPVHYLCYCDRTGRRRRDGRCCGRGTARSCRRSARRRCCSRPPCLPPHRRGSPVPSACTVCLAPARMCSVPHTSACQKAHELLYNRQLQGHRAYS